ncbi:hypothetical protein EYF80_007132 [Liparis tanakae]|uniref:Uncharacterized protein n=1 Tax=Liparis tanakae TaxID=230148 RepID=A0A4Z2IYJ8_9TELE|nr:hypothetical protein EYF80_007132 [Liparis tanakae]
MACSRTLLRGRGLMSGDSSLNTLLFRGKGGMRRGDDHETPRVPRGLLLTKAKDSLLSAATYPPQQSAGSECHGVLQLILSANPLWEPGVVRVFFSQRSRPRYRPPATRLAVACGVNRRNQSGKRNNAKENNIQEFIRRVRTGSCDYQAAVIEAIGESALQEVNKNGTMLRLGFPLGGCTATTPPSDTVDVMDEVLECDEKMDTSPVSSSHEGSPVRRRLPSGSPEPPDDPSLERFHGLRSVMDSWVGEEV